jgi:hypothetical protein
MTMARRLVLVAIGVAGLAVTASPAHAVPAFARKYGMKCTACHESWPVLNAFGRAFRDNGFRFNLGRDNATSTSPEYWPIFSWNWSGYQFNETKAAGPNSSQVLSKTGGINGGLWSLGAYVNLSEHWSLRVFAPFDIGSGPNTIAVPIVGWIRYNRLFNTQWLNVRVGSIEQDMPIAGARDLTENGVGTTVWAYTVPGSVSGYSLNSEVPGFQFDGHDRGSHTRYSLSFFSAEGAFATHHDIWATPSVFGTVTQEWQPTKGPFRQLELDLFGSYATWGTGRDSTTLVGQQRYGATLHEWFVSDALPLHLLETWVHGLDPAAFFVDATRPQVFNGYMIQADWVLQLPFVLFSRVSFIQTQQEAVPTLQAAYGNESIWLLGFKYTYPITTRFEVGVEPSYGLTLGAYRGPNGTQLQTHQFYIPIEVVF